MHSRDSIRSRFIIGLSMVLLVCGAAVASAQVLDTPSLTLQNRGFFRIDLEVQAGDSGAPEGFTIQWMKKTDFDVTGWPVDANDPTLMHADFTGEPTLNLDPNSSTFQLAPNSRIGVQMGDLFDETGVTANFLDPLFPGYYVFRVLAKGGGAVVSSSPSGEVTVATSKPECTQGYWKNHASAWPVGCTPMLLGNVSYTKTQLLAIFDQPTDGNGLVSMAHQLIAAKLNICNGSNPSNIQSTINTADAMIGNLVVPPIGSGSLPTSSTSSTTNTLDDWNNGLIPGVVNCVQPVTVRPSTWGNLKAIYR